MKVLFVITDGFDYDLAEWLDGLFFINYARQPLHQMRFLLHDLYLK